MAGLRRLVVAGVATILFGGACASITVPTIAPLPSVPPISLPTLPPITLPSGITLPTIPPITLPSGITLPSIPPISLPSADANSGICPLVSPAEMSAIMGAEATVTDNTGTNCTYTLPNFSTIVVGVDETTDLTGAKFIMGTTAKDLTIGGLPAVSGVVFGQPAVYVQKPGAQLSVLGILVGSDDATMAKMVQIATTAASRWQ